MSAFDPNSVRTWDPEAPDMDATDYVIGTVNGLWQRDDDSLIAASVVSITQVLVWGGMDPDEAFERAFSWVMPDEDDEDRTLGIKVTRDGDAWRVSYTFGDEEIG